MAEIRVDDLSNGMVDGSDGDLLPPGAFYEMSGYEVRGGYPRKMKDWYKATTNQVVTGKPGYAIHFWERETGTKLNVVAVDGILWSVNDSYASPSVVSTISDGQDSGTLSGTTVTPSATADLVQTIQVGDKFYFDADGVSERVSITAITAASFTVDAYGGASDSGAYTIVRTFSGTEINIVPAGNRLFVTDGVKRPHWYGDDGDGNDIFREAGLPLLGSVPAVGRTATGGGCSTGTYHYAVCYEDAAGRIGNPVYTQDVSCSNAAEKLTLSAIPRGPSWATRVHVYRSIVNGDVEYSICPNLTRLKGASIATSSGNSVITLNSNVPSLTADAHIHRYYTFATSGNKYRILDNATNTITVVGSGAKASESATDMGSITGGFDRTHAVASNIADVIADIELDLDHASPDENTQPLAGLKYLQKFRGGGRLIAYQNNTSTKCWISGRSTSARTATGDSTNGEGEFDYWPVYHDAGPSEGDKVTGFIPVGRRLVAVKNRSLWELYQDPDSVDEWQFFPRAQNAGSFSPKSIVNAGEFAFFVGFIDGELDLIKTDGYRAFRVFTAIDRRFKGPQLRYTLDQINRADLSDISAGIVGDRLIISFPTSTNTYNSRMIVYSLSRRTVSVWTSGHGIKVFSNIGYPSGASGEPVLAGFIDGASDTSHVYEVFSPNGETASVAKSMTTGEFSFGQEATWSTVEIDFVNAETAPTITVAYSSDGLWPSTGQSGKTWSTMDQGETWKTAAGRYTIRKHFPSAVRQHEMALRFSEPSATTSDYGVKSFKIIGEPYPQERAR